MNWLITGGCGFLGTGLIRRLVAEGAHRIRIVDNLSVGTREDLGEVTEFDELDADSVKRSPALLTGVSERSRVQLIQGDITDAQLAVEVGHGIDVIVHFAANTGVGPSVDNPRMDCISNVIGTFNYLEAARYNKIKRFVFASSGAPVGEVEPPIHEEIAPHPVSPYGASKLAGEGYCSAYFQTFGIETVALRFGNVYGPGSAHKNSVVAKFIKQALLGQSVEVFGDGSQTRDFIYLDDLLSAVLAATSAPGIGGEVFQIATAAETSVRELLELLLDAFPRYGLQKPGIVFSKPRAGDVRRNFSDTEKARDRLGWSAKVNLKDGIDATLQYFINPSQHG